MIKTIVLRCKQCEGTGKMKDGNECICHYFGGPIRVIKYNLNLWEEVARSETHE